MDEKRGLFYRFLNSYFPAACCLFYVIHSRVLQDHFNDTEYVFFFNLIDKSLKMKIYFVLLSLRIECQYFNTILYIGVE